MIRPGAVVWVDLGSNQGRQQAGRRPAVVVSSSGHLAAATALVAIVPGTTRDRGWPNHVALVGPVGLGSATFAMTEQVRTISRERLGGTAGSVDEGCLDYISQWVHRWLA